MTETAHQINEINGILVNQRLRYNQKRLSALQAAARGLHDNGLYGSNGQPQILLPADACLAKVPQGVKQDAAPFIITVMWTT